MIDFEIHQKIQKIGSKKGRTVYYAHPKPRSRMTTRMLVDRIVRETSLSHGDVSNALISLSQVVSEALQMGLSVDLAELGAFRLSVPARTMDTPEEVTVSGSLGLPKIVFTPKQAMRRAARSVEMSVDHSRVLPSRTFRNGHPVRRTP